MGEVLDRAGLGAGLETAGIAWRELNEVERARYAVDGVEPTALCWPATYPEAAQALAVADRLGLAVAPRGAGTKVALGNSPRAVELIVSTEKLNRIVEYAPANLTVTVEAGVPLAELQARLGTEGQFLPLDPPWADRTTLGGIVAANASGPRRLGYGSARDLVIGTRAATTSGTVVRAGGRVVKNVAGYDLNKLYVGSLGTLVVLVEIGLKVAPLPARAVTVIGHFAQLAQLAEAAKTIVRSPLLPNALDLLNARAARGLPVKAMPRPKDGYLLAALGTAPGSGVERQRDELAKAYRAVGATEVVAIEGEESDAFWRHVVEGPTRDLGDGGIRAKVAVPIGRVPEAVRALEDGGSAVGEAPAVGGRAGSGVLTATWSATEAPSPDRLAGAADALGRLRASVAGLGGSLVVEDCPRSLKDRLDVWGDVGASLTLMRRLKAALDPNAILNPGRFVGGI